jgi:hypothetical protein
MRRALLTIVLGLEGIAAAAAPGGSPPPDPVFALVVGVNQPIDPGPPKLLYADDDAILFHKLFSQVGRSLLLIAPDAATGRLHGALQARAPTRANLKLAVDELLGLVAASRRRGERPQLYFVYSGHGDVRNNEGYLSLEDDRFTSRDLAELILSRSRAAANHVIVDACKSYFIIRERRAEGSREAAPPGLHRTQTLLDRFPATGFLLSTTSAASSHEWEEFQAGIFSHEVRSGLLGAADINRDGRVSYNEIRAFVEVANSAIRNERYRPNIFVRPPRDDGQAALYALRRGAVPALIVPRAKAGRYFLEDANGVRLADMHTATTGAVTIAVPRDTHLYMHDLSRSVEYLVDPRPGQRQIVALPVRPASHRMKGTGHEAFQKIFSVPFGVPAFKALMRRYAQDDPKLRGTECVRCVCEPCEQEPAPPPAVPAPPPPVHAVVAKPAARPAWEPVLEGGLGISFFNRSFDLSDPLQPAQSPSYRSGLIPMLGFGLAAYPLAVLRAGPLQGLGLVASFRRSVGLTSQLGAYSASADTVLQDVAAGLRYRLLVGADAGWPWLTLRFGLEGGVQSFSIDWEPSVAKVMPDVSYPYLKIPLDLELALLRGRAVLSLLFGIDYLVVLSGGEIERSDASGYGQASLGGLDLRGGVELRGGPFFLRASYAYRRVWLSFDNDCFVENTGCKAAGGALDVSSGLDLLLGAAF